MLRRISWVGPLMLGVCMACYHNDGKPASPQPTPPPPSNSAPPISPSSVAASTPQPDSRRLTVIRTHDGHSASGLVLLREPMAPDAGTSPHLKLAGSRAWLAMGEQRFAAEDWTGAVACAQAGLAELGNQYASRRALDHTFMKLHVAKEQLKGGNLEAAAEIMLRQLTTRTHYYADLHADEIAE